MSKIAVTIIASILFVGFAVAKGDTALKTNSSNTRVVHHGEDNKTRVMNVLQTRLSLQRTSEIPMSKTLCSVFNGIYVDGKCFVLIGKEPRTPPPRLREKRN